MTVETDIFTALKGLVSDRVYRDIAPQTVTDLPRITFQQVGGESINCFDTFVPNKKNGRFQINVWGADRDSVAVLARQVEDTLRVYAALQTTVMGEPVALYEPETRLYGTRQDFSVWFDT
jgi:hypothetical protein